jgi:hypothetical protein
MNEAINNSEIKNDQTGIKQKILGPVFTLVALAVLFFNSDGVTLQCHEDNCSVNRQGALSQSQESFPWSMVESVRITEEGAGTRRTGPTSRGADGDDLELHLKGNRRVKMFGSPVAWKFGTLDRIYLQNLIDLGEPPIEGLYGYSLGGLALFFSFTMGSIGMLFFLLPLVRHFHADMNEIEIQTTRLYNLKVFFFLFLAGLFFWGSVLILIIRRLLT